MKKILIATTALVATAGVAAAEVNFSGGARFGAYYDGSSTSLTSRFTLNIDGTAESDGGLSFGARVRIRQNGSVPNELTATKTVVNGARFTVSTGGLTVGVGNILGAIDSMPGLYSGSVGLTGLGYGNVVAAGTHAYASDAQGAIDGVEVIYSADAFTVHLSTDTGHTEVAASFSFGDWTIGAGFSDGATDWILTAGGQIGSVTIGAALSDAAGTTNARLSAGFSVGSATTINVYVADAFGNTNYGLGVVHSLGGGTSIRGGVASLGGTTRADLGLNFNF